MGNHVIIADRKQSDSMYNKNFKRCVGSGRMSLALRQDYMENLKIVQQEIGFEYIRGHGLFNDDMGVYREVIQMGATPLRKLERPLFNFKNILKVFDNFLSVGIKPFVEFGFMPSQMAAGDKTVFWWKGNVTEPKDIDLWNELVEKLLRTVIDYYGMDEVKSWYFEVWNEPCVDFWQPTSGKREEEYYLLYEETAKTVKQVCQDLRVGGPATQGQGLDWIPRFLHYCFEHNIPLDFVSHHIYTGSNRELVGEFVYMNHVEPAQTREKYVEVRRLANQAPQGALPLHITEWNTSFSCIDIVHDTAFNAAYIAYLLTHVDDQVESYAYWVFCDVFEEADVPRALFHGGFGLLTENGIRKPVFHAFAFANKLKPNILHRDEVSCVTEDEQGNLAILLFNPVVNTDQGETRFIELDLPCRFEEVVVSLQKVDDENGNAHTVWKRLGRPRWPNQDKLDMIKRAQYPAFTTFRLLSVGGRLRLSTELPMNGVQLLEITPFTDYSGDYQGLRA